MGPYTYINKLVISGSFIYVIPALNVRPGILKFEIKGYYGVAFKLSDYALEKAMVDCWSPGNGINYRVLLIYLFL